LSCTVDNVGREELSKMFILYLHARLPVCLTMGARIEILLDAEVKCAAVGAGVRGNVQIDGGLTKNNYQVID
jgi:hypothetical protein